MQHKKHLILFLLVLLFCLLIHNYVYGDILNSDWIGTINKSYELAWQQDTEKRYNSYGTEFFLEYTYLSKDNKNIPTYCIEYYLKGPKNNTQYGKTKLKDLAIPDSVLHGLMSIIKNGYPNVQLPFGTKDVSEAYYATSAAVHIWTMYYGIDEVAGKDLGWFQYKDGFILNESCLQKYIDEYSTKSTASGWHVIRANDNNASKRTWIAAMNLLRKALKPDISEPYINIENICEPYVSEKYVISKFKVTSNICQNIKIKLDKEITGTNIEYEENNNSIIATVYLPAELLKEGDILKVSAYGEVIGADDVNNYYYLYHQSGSYQTMVYMDPDGRRNINSKALSITIPNLTAKIYYDLNYSGVNYIKGGSFANFNIVSYDGDKAISIIGTDKYYTYKKDGSESDAKALRISFENNSNINTYILFNTLLPGTVSDGYKSHEKMYLTFSCWIKADNNFSLKLAFENSNTVYEKQISKADDWQLITVHLLKTDSDSNSLCIYSNTEVTLDMYKPQLEEGNIFTTYRVEEAPISDPTYTEHKIGVQCGHIYADNEPNRVNYIFLGWNTKKDGSGCYIDSSYIADSGDIVLYAIWTNKPTYCIYLHYGTNGGEYIQAGNSALMGTDGVYEIEIPNHTIFDLSKISAYKNMYEFVGWTYDFGLKEINDNEILNRVQINGADIHLYANYKRDYQIYYHYYDEALQSGEIIKTVKRTVYNNYKLYAVTTLPAYKDSEVTIPNVEGYYLKGWSASENSKSDAEYAPGEIVSYTEHEHYYAVYEKEIVVNFYDNESDMGKLSVHGDDSGLHCCYELLVTRNYKGDINFATFSLPENICENDEYEFYGWSDKAGFDGSILYYARNNGIEIKTDQSMNFYALYVKNNTVSFFDYDFSKKSGHMEKVIYAYMYMNFEGSILIPEIIIPSCCICGEEWSLIGWNESNDPDDNKKLLPGDSIKVYEEMYLYAVYSGTVSINFHSLSVENGKLKNVINTSVINCSMNSNGFKNIERTLIPETESFIHNDNTWECIGYTDTNPDSVSVTHKINEFYIFEKNTDLYAIYNSEIKVDFYDYNEPENKQEYSESDYNISLTCNTNINPVRVILPQCIGSGNHDGCGWNDSSEFSDEIKYFPGEALDIIEDSTYYSIYIDNYILTCNDMANNTKRISQYSSKVYGYYNGFRIGEDITIPMQGTGNDFLPSESWNSGNEFNAEYISGEKLIIYEDITLNAIYKKNINVIFDANGGAFTGGLKELITPGVLYYNVSGKYKAPFFVSESVPIRTYYNFLDRWNTSPDASGIDYFHGEAVTTTESMRLYALWEKASAPKLDVIDRYYFVGDNIKYEDIIRKIITVSPDNNSSIEEVRIINIDDIDTSEMDNGQIEACIDTSKPSKYKITVEFVHNAIVLIDEFDLYIVESDYSPNKLRYISKCYLDTIKNDSKWKTPALYEKLKNLLNLSPDDAKWSYTVEKKD